MSKQLQKLRSPFVESSSLTTTNLTPEVSFAHLQKYISKTVIRALSIVVAGVCVRFNDFVHECGLDGK